ncbi:non-ribosomal peptide synthetase [Dactylosporangium aurantiacum]|uniref:Non-ribosomal peptide synthetase n=1 Tax=Dactylosporangium aurantiacum TaxID=35754 RepID=A0A9Q9ICP6_9ACTN|nr:non-ribosomal peptide synthetase [Dactylosporangium aurantiacum]MDG6106871.1 non-ribosomal peptide synthetase [Dactylosporangium aurantiacum]UWZ51004.1 non-ribosomal peptide synthetase [Dactylosporangium aurantiacum]
MPSTDRSTTFRRAVSPVEWWIAAHPRGAVPVLQVAVEGTGALDPGRLAEAVTAASDACPGTRLARKGREWVDTGRPPAVRTVEPGGVPVHRLPQLQEPLLHRGRPTCEVLHVGGPEPAVVFRASHAVMDAGGVLLWAADVFRALRGEPLTGATDTVTEVDLLPPLTQKPTPPGLRYPALLGRRAPGGPRRTLWLRRSVDGYHAGLIARLATTIAPLCGDGDAQFSVPVNLRRYAPQTRSTASLSHSLPFTVPAGQDWEATHERLLTLLAEERDAQARLDPAVLKIPQPVLRFINGALERKAATQDLYPSHASLAHLGRVDVEEFSTGGFAATAVYSLSSSPAGGPVELDVVECAGHTEITLSWHDGPGIEDAATALLDRIEAALSPPALRTPPMNATSVPVPGPGTVLPAFAAQCAATPDALAVSGPDGDLTYAELDRRSRVVAAALRDLGLGREDVVGVLADRSAAAVAAIWGVVRSGAAYLPLDVQHPDARLADILTDAGAPVCLVQRPHDTRDVVPAGCRTVLLDELTGEPPADWTEPATAPGDLAYVIYTSGSTGRPKGVEIEHGSLANYAAWATRALGVDASTRMPLLTSFAFDVSCTSLFLPLLAGGAILLPPGELNHATLRTLLTDAAPTVLTMTPSLLELICELDVRPGTVRVVAAAGEVLRRSLALRALEMFGPGCRVMNLYGPTEATIECLAHTFDPATDTAAGVPIGVPPDNCTAHVLDAQHRFVAPGEAGELYVGGVQLARGYRGRPDLTRTRFVRLADGTRVYRTGDIVRVTDAGVVEFLTRADDQVKVLGNRIEPAEIAQTLEDHPSVTRATVIARGRPGGEHKLLCAYVVGADPDPARLQAFVAERLPRYMVPATVTVVAELPRTVNGKIDVRALPDPFAGAGEPAAEPAARDEVTRAVAAVWAGTLGVEPDRIADDTDFHQLGGDSLLMLSMVAAVCRDVVGADAEPLFMARLGEIVREPTIARVAAVARAATGASAGVPQPVGAGG